jgi:butyryl-CoA dehydrogenase
MFHMMNEARIAVGLGATMLGFAGYERRSTTPAAATAGAAVGPAGKDPDAAAGCASSSTADVKRMLLAQKSYCEGRACARLYCARLGDELHTGTDGCAPRTRARPARGADPIAKSWPSEWCLEANCLAIQVARRLRLHARLPGRAVLARQPPQHDPRGHARHPGAR